MQDENPKAETMFQRCTKIAEAVAFGFGTVGLSAAALTDFVGVVGRHLGHPVAGTIEIFRVCAAVVVSAAIVLATLSGGHASVHVFVERMGPLWRARSRRIGAIIAAAMFTAIVVASGWLLVLTARGLEATFLLNIPLWPFRLIWCAASAWVASWFLVNAFVRNPE